MVNQQFGDDSSGHVGPTKRRGRYGPSEPPMPPTSSQAGLTSMQGPRHSVPSMPADGQPGSRFNPIVRERSPRRIDGSAVETDPRDPDLITEVPTSVERVERGRSPEPPENGPTHSPSSQAGLSVRDGDPVARSAPESATRRMRMPTAEEVSAGGRIARQGAAGAAVGAKLTAAIPHPAGKVVGVVGGAVVGGAKGLVNEADQRVEAKKNAAEQTGPSPSDSESVGRWLPEGLRKDHSRGVENEPTISRTYGYQFEQGCPDQGGPEMGR